MEEIEQFVCPSAFLCKLKNECEEFISNKRMKESKLYYKSIKCQISKMICIFNTTNPTPTWITIEEIEKLKNKMNQR